MVGFLRQQYYYHSFFKEFYSTPKYPITETLAHLCLSPLLSQQQGNGTRFNEDIIEPQLREYAVSPDPEDITPSF